MNDTPQCSKGWGARCAASKGKRCRCQCGGHNHGHAHNAEKDGVRHAQWILLTVSREEFVIRDTGHMHGRSITNDAEYVVERIAPSLNGRRLFYYDSMNNLDELLVRDGRFAGFAPGPRRMAGVA